MSPTRTPSARRRPPTRDDAPRARPLVAGWPANVPFPSSSALGRLPRSRETPPGALPTALDRLPAEPPRCPMPPSPTSQPPSHAIAPDTTSYTIQSGRYGLEMAGFGAGSMATLGPRQEEFRNGRVLHLQSPGAGRILPPHGHLSCRRRSALHHPLRKTRSRPELHSFLASPFVPPRQRSPSYGRRCTTGRGRGEVQAAP